VLRALEAGALYGSCGPRIDSVSVAARFIEVACSPCRAVTLVAGRTAGSAVNAGRLGYTHHGRILATDESGLVIRARLSVPPLARHLRLELTDARGRKAWAPPITV
jgi:hypothetical protein